MLNSFTEAIYAATEVTLRDPRTHILGLGATYKNGLDGTMKDLAERHPAQVHDTPCSEAAVTGMAVGMATNGLRPIVHHGRIEFALYAMNQILTEAANWNYMFGGDYPCPLTIRICIGRQWGNGPAHTRSLKALFAVPGLKVVCPSSPRAAHDLLINAHLDRNPVVYLEPRWLYKTKETVLEAFDIDAGSPMLPLNRARVLRQGKDITVVAVGEAVLEALKAAKVLWEASGISAEVIDLVSIYPMDISPVFHSVQKTNRLVVIEAAPHAFNVAGELLSSLAAVEAPVAYYASFGCLDTPCPTAPGLTKGYYPEYREIVSHICTTAFGLLPPTLEAPTFAERNLPPTDNFDDLLK